jgi:hypothetical protein
MAIHTVNPTEAEAPKSGSEIIAQRFDEYMGNCEGDPEKETQAILALEDKLRLETLNISNRTFLELTAGNPMNTSQMLTILEIAAHKAAVTETIRTRSQLNQDYEKAIDNNRNMTSLNGLNEINGQTEHGSMKEEIKKEFKKAIINKKAALRKSQSK